MGTNEVTGTPNLPGKITILRGPDGNLKQRLVMAEDANGSLAQTLEVTVEIGRDVPPQIYDVGVTAGAVVHVKPQALNVVRLALYDKQDHSLFPVAISSNPRPVVHLDTITTSQVD